MSEFRIRVSTEGEASIDRLDSKVKKLDNTAKNNTKTTDNLGNSYSNLAKTVGAAAAGILAFQTVSKGIDAYRVQEQAVAKLNATLIATGGAAGFSSKELQDFASELQDLTLFGDEATISMMSVLNTFKQISGNTYKRAVVAIQDLSAAMGQD